MATNGTIPAGKLSPLSRAVPFQRVVCFCSCLIYELKNTHVILEYRLLERKREWVGMGGGGVNVNLDGMDSNCVGLDLEGL